MVFGKNIKKKRIGYGLKLNLLINNNTLEKYNIYENVFLNNNYNNFMKIDEKGIFLKSDKGR